MRDSLTAVRAIHRLFNMGNALILGPKWQYSSIDQNPTRNQQSSVRYTDYVKTGEKKLSFGMIGFRLTPTKDELETALKHHQSSVFVYLGGRAVDASELEQHVTNVTFSNGECVVHVEYKEVEQKIQ